MDGVIVKIGRNDPCPCGSGNKYKKCCEPKDAAARSAALAAQAAARAAEAETTPTEQSAAPGRPTPDRAARTGKANAPRTQTGSASKASLPRRKAV